MLFRIVIVCILLAASYAAFEIGSAWYFYKSVRTPASAFTIKNDGNQSELTIVEFLTYDCQNCRDTHKVLKDYADRNQDVRLAVRLVPMDWGYAEESTEMALAAGLQGKFWEFDAAIAEYQGRPDERFYRETASLLDMNYERLRKDAKAKTVQDMATDNASAALKLGLTSVPALMIGKTLYQPDKALTMNELISMVAAERTK